MSQTPFALYNPSLLPPDVLLAEFTARRPLLEILLAIIRGNAPGQPPQHCLLIGARGMGKTTTLWAVSHSVQRDVGLSSEWEPIVFDEESRRVGDLADFWLEAIRQWEHATQDAGGRAEKLLAEPTPDIETRAQTTFLEMLDLKGKRALLLIDNLNELLGSIREPEALHRLRAFLMNEPRVMVIGAATRYFEQITSIDQPFYDFFRYFELRPLSLDEMQLCLRTLAETRGNDSIRLTLKKRSGTVRALNLLTGGNPRLIKMFYRLLADGLRGDIRADLERLLDEFTPYFKAIVDALPVQQQRIFDAVALAWDPVEVASVAQATRLPSNQVSAQLGALIRAGLIAEAAGSRSKKTYLLADRFSNIHYLMRHGRAARNRFDWFVALVRLVFPDQEATDVLADVAQQASICGPDGQRDARAVMQSALKRTESLESRRALVHATLKRIWDKDTLVSLDQWFDTNSAKQDLPEVEIVAFFKQMPTTLRQKLGYAPDQGKWWYALTNFLEEKAAWPLAEAAYRKSIELSPADSRPWIGLAHLLQSNLHRYVESEAAYRKAIDLDPNNARTWYNLGILLGWTLKRPTDAESAFRRSLELRAQSASTWVALGRVLAELLDRPAEAEPAFRKAIEIEPKVADHWQLLASLFRWKLERLEDAEIAIRKAIEVDPNGYYYWYFLGNLLESRDGHVAEAEVAIRKSIELNPRFPSSWCALGFVLSWNPARSGDAILAYRKAIEIDPDYVFAILFLAAELSKIEGSREEPRRLSKRALVLRPDLAYCRTVFTRVCGSIADDWRDILPALATFCLAHPKEDKIYNFTIEGFLNFARLRKPVDALNLLDSLSDSSPFETLRDAFRSYSDRNHLASLAPERQTIAVELLKRMSEVFVSSETAENPIDAIPSGQS